MTTRILMVVPLALLFACATGGDDAEAPTPATLSTRLAAAPTFASRDRISLPIIAGADSRRIIAHDFWLALHETPSGEVTIDDAVLAVYDAVEPGELGLHLRSIRIVPAPAVESDDAPMLEPTRITSSQRMVRRTMTVTLVLDWALSIDGTDLPAGLQEIAGVPLVIEVERVGADDHLQARVAAMVPVTWDFGFLLAPGMLSFDLSAREQR